MRFSKTEFFGLLVLLVQPDRQYLQQKARLVGCWSRLVVLSIPGMVRNGNLLPVLDTCLPGIKSEQVLMDAALLLIKTLDCLGQLVPIVR